MLNQIGNKLYPITFSKAKMRHLSSHVESETPDFITNLRYAIPDLPLETGGILTVQNYPTKIFDEKKMKKKMDLKTNGFEFVTVDSESNLYKALQQLKTLSEQEPLEEVKTLEALEQSKDIPKSKLSGLPLVIAEITDATESWFKKKFNSSNADYKCFGPNIRFKSKRNTGTANGPIDIIHADFKNNDDVASFKKTQFVSNNSHDFDVVGSDVLECVNLWLPFDKVVSDPLVLLDFQTLNSSNVKPNVQTQEYQKRFSTNIDQLYSVQWTSLYLSYDKEQQWRYYREIDIGTFIMFETVEKAFHSSAEIPNQPNISRKSLDYRCVKKERKS